MYVCMHACMYIRAYVYMYVGVRMCRCVHIDEKTKQKILGRVHRYGFGGAVCKCKTFRVQTDLPELFAYYTIGAASMQFGPMRTCHS